MISRGIAEGLIDSNRGRRRRTWGSRGDDAAGFLGFVLDLATASGIAVA